jgi:periplasmic divalent cation tolerance protein
MWRVALGKAEGRGIACVRQMSAGSASGAADAVWKDGKEGEEGYRVVFVTFGSMESAKSVVTEAVRARHAACGNLVPGITSIYEWEGKLHEDGEVLAILKTAADKVDGLVSFVRSAHPYTEPEIIALPIERGSASYLDWVRRQTRST